MISDLKKKINQKQVVVAAVVLCILMFIWFVLPYLFIGNIFPFADYRIRISLVALVIAITAAISLYFYIKNPAQMPTSHEYGIHSQLIERAYRQLHHFFRVKKYQVSNQRWYMLLGSKNSGRSHIMARSECGIKQSNQENTKSIISSFYCDYWLQKQAIFIEPQMKYLLDDYQDEANYHYWLNLFKVLKKYRHNKIIDGAIIVIDAETLCYSGDREIAHTLHIIKNQIHLLRSFNNTTPFSIIISKADLIPGFVESFIGLSYEQRERQLGVSFDLDHQKNIATQFDYEFTRLIEQLKESKNNDIENGAKVSSLVDFVDQLCYVKQRIRQFLLDVPWGKLTPLMGVYFSSTQQIYASGQNTSKIVKKHMAKNKHMSVYKYNRSYFLKDLIGFFIKDNDDSKGHRSYGVVKRASAAVLVSGLLLFMMAGLFFYNDNQIRTTTTVVNQEIDMNNQSLHGVGPSWLNKLELLRKAVHLKAGDDKWYDFLHLNSISSEAVALKKNYLSLDKRYMSTYLGEVLLQQMNASSKDVYWRYQSLNTYLMVSSENAISKKAVTNWFDKYLLQQYPASPALRRVYMQNFAIAIDHNLIKLQYNPELVNLVRANIVRGDLAEVIYEKYHQQLLGNVYNVPKEIIGSSMLKVGVKSFPAAFTAEKFNDVYQKLIPAVCQEMLESDDVLNFPQSYTFSSTQKNQLISQMRLLYLKEYAANWTNVINHFNISKMISVSAVKKFSEYNNLFMNHNSVLWKFMRLVYNNVYIANAGNDFNSIVENHFSWLATDIPLQGTNSAYVQSLTNYSHAIDDVIQSNQKKAAFDFLSAIYSSNQASPYFSLYTLVHNKKNHFDQMVLNYMKTSIKVTSSVTRAYLNDVWQQVMYPAYQKGIENFFPINQSSTHDIGYDDFTSFFAANGSMPAYFSYYIQPFVDTSQQYWQWRSVLGVNVGFSQQVLDMFLRAELIQQMFYSESETKPSFSFSMRLLRLSSNVQSFILNIQGQMISVTQGSRQEIQVHWPGPNPGFVTMRFNNPSENNPTITKTGDWDLMRLFAMSLIKPTANSAVYQVTFHVGDAAAVFALTMKNKVNPLLPGILTGFHVWPTLPKKS